MRDENMRALTLLLRVFHGLSTEPVEDDELFAREVSIRCKLWRDVEGWTLKAGGLLHGYFELHLREAVLGVRVFRNQPNEDPICVARMRILLDEANLVNSSIDLTDDPDSRLVAAHLLQAISTHGQLRPLAWSMARALRRFVQSIECEART